MKSSHDDAYLGICLFLVGIGLLPCLIFPILLIPLLAIVVYPLAAAWLLLDCTRWVLEERFEIPVSRWIDEPFVRLSRSKAFQSLSGLLRPSRPPSHALSQYAVWFIITFSLAGMAFGLTLTPVADRSRSEVPEIQQNKDDERMYLLPSALSPTESTILRGRSTQIQ